MADKYLLEDGTGGYLLEDDSGGEYIIEQSATAEQTRAPLFVERWIIRRDYSWVQETNIALLAGEVVVEALPAGRSVQELAPRPLWLRTRMWSAEQLLEEQMPVGQSVLRLVARPEWPRVLRTWLQSNIYQEALPVGQSVLRLVARPILGARTWIQSQALEESLPIGQTVQRLALQPPRRGYDFIGVAQLADTAAPAGASVQRLVRWPDYPLSLRSRMQSTGAVLFPEFMPGQASSFWDFRKVRLDYGLVRGTNIALLGVAEEVQPPKLGQLPKVVRQRDDFSWTHPTNIALMSEVVVEAVPVGASVQQRLRLEDYRRDLRGWTREQGLEEPLPSGQQISKRLRDPEFLRSLRSRTSGAIFEEAMPPRAGQLPKIERFREGYNWVQATNIALLETVVETLLLRATPWENIRRPRASYSWVQATNVALVTEVVQVPAGKSIQARLRDPEYLRSLRSRASAPRFEERMPVGDQISQRLRDPEFLRSRRGYTNVKGFEERMPVGARVSRRLDDPEFLRSLRHRSKSFLPLEVVAVNVELTPDFFEDADEFFPPIVQALAPPPLYDYPVGRSLTSDYGIRGSKLGRRRLIIGRR